LEVNRSAYVTKTNQLATIVQWNPTATLSEIRQAFARLTGVDVHKQTTTTTLNRPAIRRVATDEAVNVERAEAGPHRCDYAEAH
jgi:hypothetical protein